MAQPVPYEGAPELTPRFEPTPSMGIQPSPQAFGVGVAQSIQHLGEVQQSAGKELFDRAFAMEELHQHAAANAALAEMQNKQTQRAMDFYTKEGNAAHEAFPGYQAGLDQDREEGAKNLSPYARNLYDGESRSLTGRAKFSGALHAGAEEKKYVVGSSKAVVESTINSMSLNPADEAGYRKDIDTIKKEIEFQNTSEGLKPGDPKWDLNMKNEVSRAVERRARALAENDPVGARKLFDKALKDGDLTSTGTDIYGRGTVERLGDYIKQRQDQIGSRHEASQIMSGAGFQFGQGVVPNERAQIGIKAIEGGVYGKTGPTVDDHQGHIGNGLGAYQVMSYNLQDWLHEAGMDPMSKEQFLADRSAQDQLFNFKFGQYMQKYKSFNRAASAWFTGNPDAPLDRSDGYHTLSEYLQTSNRALARSASLGELSSIAQAHAATVAPNDPDFADAIESRISTIHENDVRVLKDTEWHNKQTIENSIVTGDLAGKIPTTVEELTATPEAKAAWDAMLPSDRHKYLDEMSRNAKGDVAMTQSRLATYQQLVGEATHRQDAFLKEDILSKDLPIATKKELINKQAAVYAKSEAYPNVGHALRVLGPQLQSARLNPQDDRDNYELFTGVLHDTIEDFQKTNDRRPSDDEIEVMGARLLNRVSSGWFGGTSPWFESSVPPEAADMIRNSPKWAEQGIKPTDDMIRQAYIRAQYRNLYQKKAKSESSGDE